MKVIVGVIKKPCPVDMRIVVRQHCSTGAPFSRIMRKVPASQCSWGIKLIHKRCGVWVAGRFTDQEFFNRCLCFEIHMMNSYTCKKARNTSPTFMLIVWALANGNIDSSSGSMVVRIISWISKIIDHFPVPLCTMRAWFALGIISKSGRLHKICENTTTVEV